jgi:hypothetical protein
MSENPFDFTINYAEASDEIQSTPPENVIYLPNNRFDRLVMDVDAENLDVAERIKKLKEGFNGLENPTSAEKNQYFREMDIFIERATRKNALSEMEKRVEKLLNQVESTPNGGKLAETFVMDARSVQVLPRKFIIEAMTQGAFLVENKTTILISSRGAGKTTFFGEMIAACVKGGHFYGDFFNVPEPMDVLYVMCEGDQQDIREKTDIIDPEINYKILDATTLSIEELAETLKYLILNNGIKVIAFDSASIHAQRNTAKINDLNEVSKYLGHLIPLSKLGASIVISWHATNKDDNAKTARGASSIEDDAANIFLLTPVEGENGKTGTRLSNTKFRHNKKVPVEYFELDDAGKIRISPELREYVSQREAMPQGTIGAEISAEKRKNLSDMRIKEILFAWNQLIRKGVANINYDMLASCSNSFVGHDGLGNGVKLRKFIKNNQLDFSAKKVGSEFHVFFEDSFELIDIEKYLATRSSY